MGNVILGGKFKKTSEMLDRNGNIIDPITKEVIQKKDKESVVTPEPPKPVELEVVEADRPENS